MSRTSVFTIIIIMLLVSSTGALFLCRELKTPSDDDIAVRQSFTSLTGLPDISVYIESPSERYRSLTNSGAIYPYDPFMPDTDFSSIVFKKVNRYAKP